MTTPVSDDPSGIPLTEQRDSALQTLCRLARSHFQVASAAIAVHDRRGATCLAFDGAPVSHLPDTSISDTRTCIVASCDLTDASGCSVGVLALLDPAPRTFDSTHTTFLRDLARLAEHAIAAAEEAGRLKRRIGRMKEDGELTSLALSGSGTGVWDRNVVTGEIHYSPDWHALIGYEPHELSNRIEDAVERLHADDREYVKAAMQAHFDGTTPGYAVEHRIRCKDGSYKWICSRGKVVSRDATGRALRMVGTTTDITALRELTQRLQHSIDLVTNLTHQVPGLVFQMHQSADGQCRFSYASDGIREIYELTPEDIQRNAHAIDALIDPRDLAAYRASQRASAASLTPWRLEYRVNLPRQGLRWREGEARPQRGADGGTVWHGFITDATERKRIEAELKSLATTDHLTQLSNRREFVSQSEAVLDALRQRVLSCASTLLLDLDHFKVLNDRWGHSLGDRALAHFAALLRAAVEQGAIVARIGGEEFAVLLPGADIDTAHALAVRLQARVHATPLLHGDERIAMTVSIGIDSMLGTDIEAAQTLSRADIALYGAKKRGRNRIEVFRNAARPDIDAIAGVN